MVSPISERPSFEPRNWGGWLALGLVWMMGQIPQPAGLALSRPLGWLLLRLMRGRQRVARRNIDRCFPEMTDEQRSQVVRDHFRSLARMLFETAWVWAASEKRLDSWGRAEDAEHANKLNREGEGVQLLTAHSTCLELAGWCAGRSTFNLPWVVYRPLNSPVLEWYSNLRRERFTGGAISKRVFRSMVSLLEEGGMLWYAPDQDFGPERSEFAPFFGIQTATLGALVRLVEKSGCKVVPMFTAFDEKSRKYIARFHPPLEDFPSGDIKADLARINQLMEEHIRVYPAQYWWIHRRFKTRPDGEPPFYD